MNSGFPRSWTCQRLSTGRCPRNGRRSELVRPGRERPQKSGLASVQTPIGHWLDETFLSPDQGHMNEAGSGSADYRFYFNGASDAGNEPVHEITGSAALDP